MDVPRWLALAGPDGEAGWRANLGWFRRLVLLHMAVRMFLLLHQDGFAGGFETPLRAAAIVTGLVGLAPGAGLWAARIALPLVATEIGWTLTTRLDATNHVAVELCLLFFLALLDERDEGEARLLLPSLRWFIAVFFFYTGLQKLFYGYYSQGQYLAFAAATEERFTWLFRHLIPAAELARLQSYNERLIHPGVWQPKVPSGPYVVASALFRALSNAVYLFEMAAGAGLLWRRTRAVAAVAAVLFVVCIELGAREITFGLLMVNLLLLFLPGGWNRRLFPLSAAGYAYLVLHELVGQTWFLYAPA
jgi:hypothetical protein